MSGNDYNMIIIGGGISGLGIALEAALNAIPAVLFERGEICKATSANSLRIIHGGFRYLQQLDLRRVTASAQAQADLLADFPDVIKPLPCLMPLSAFGLKSKIPLSCASALYNLLVRKIDFRPPPPRVVSKRFISDEASSLSDAAPHGAFFWHDALLADPDALVYAVRERATACGTVIHENAQVRTVIRGEDGFKVTINRGGKTETVRSKIVVDASGPWLGKIELRGLGGPTIPDIAWCKAFNLVIGRQLSHKYALGVESPRGRLFFAVPRAEGSVLGTGYVPHSAHPDKIGVTDDEIQVFLKDFNESLPGLNLNRSDVVSTEVGILPMKVLGPDGPILLGSEQIFETAGYISVLSTKYTTFRVQAQEVIRCSRSLLGI